MAPVGGPTAWWMRVVDDMPSCKDLRPEVPPPRPLCWPLLSLSLSLSPRCVLLR